MKPLADYAECLGHAFAGASGFGEDYPSTATASRREFFRDVRIGAARLYRGRRAHDRAMADSRGLFDMETA